MRGAAGRLSVSARKKLPVKCLRARLLHTATHG